MSRLVWDQTGERLFEVGVRNCVLYPVTAAGNYGTGVAWNGITSITQSSEGADPNKIYADDIIYAIIRSAEEFNASIEAYTYPDEFAECDGSALIGANGGLRLGQQKRRMFGLCYRTEIGNDVVGDELGYKIHLIYGCTASPSEKQYNTINDSPDPIQFSWDIDCLPVEVNIPGKNYLPVAHIEVDSTKVSPEIMAQLENLVYGTDGDNPTTPQLPLPKTIIELIEGV